MEEDDIMDVPSKPLIITSKYIEASALNIRKVSPADNLTRKNTWNEGKISDRSSVSTGRDGYMKKHITKKDLKMLMTSREFSIKDYRRGGG